MIYELIILLRRKLSLLYQFVDQSNMHDQKEFVSKKRNQIHTFTEIFFASITQSDEIFYKTR